MSLLGCLLIAFVSLGCDDSGKAAKPEHKSKSGPKLETKADGLAYEVGADLPFTGTSRSFDKASGLLNRETEYQDGLKHGWERKWFRDNPEQMERQKVWVKGQPAFHWSWWPNGNLRELSSQTTGKKFGREDITYGTYVKWFEDGTIQFKAHYDENFHWHGHTLDFNDARQLMWDAEFKNGIYQKGIRPPEEAKE